MRSGASTGSSSDALGMRGYRETSNRILGGRLQHEEARSTTMLVQVRLGLGQPGGGSRRARAFAAVRLGETCHDDGA